MSLMDLLHCTVVVIYTLVPVGGLLALSLLDLWTSDSIQTLSAIP